MRKGIKYTLNRLNRIVETRKKLKGCGWSDADLEREYRELLEEIRGGVWLWKWDGTEYVVCDVEFRDHSVDEEGVVLVVHLSLKRKREKSLWQGVDWNDVKGGE